MEIFAKIKGIKSYLYRNLIAPRWYSWRDREILSRNRALRGKYAGKRCFIIGGGPSVSDIDLGLLRNECTFVMTEFDKDSQYNKLRPKFHAIIDSIYCYEHESEYWPSRFKAKDQSVDPSTTLLLNLETKTFVEKYNLFKKHQVYYMGTQGIFTDNLPFNIALDKYVPQPKNSVLMCLMIAAWMGFKEIYLLGCEHNFLSQNIGFGKSIVYDHSYKDGLSELDSSNKELMDKYFRSRDIYMNYEKNIANILQLFKNYRFFFQKSKKLYPGINIYNATPNSFLDVFPMVNFEDIKF